MCPDTDTWLAATARRKISLKEQFQPGNLAARYQLSPNRGLARLDAVGLCIRCPQWAFHSVFELHVFHCSIFYSVLDSLNFLQSCTSPYVFEVRRSADYVQIYQS